MSGLQAFPRARPRTFLTGWKVRGLLAQHPADSKEFDLCTRSDGDPWSSQLQTSEPRQCSRKWRRCRCETLGGGAAGGVGRDGGRVGAAAAARVCEADAD